MRLSMIAILLNPLADAGLGSAPAGPNPAPTPPPAAPAMVPLTIEEYNRLRGLETQFSEFRTARQQELDAKEAERVQALADKGRIQEALDLQRTTLEGKLSESSTKYVELERQVFSERKAAVIAEAFAGKVFSGQTPEQQAVAAGQARQLLEGQFETVRDASGALVVRHKLTGRPAAEVIRESLASPDFQHFLAPESRGGTGAPGSSAGTPPPAGQPFAPGSLDHIAAEFKASQLKYQSMGMHGTPIRPSGSAQIR